jgi:Transposase DDE domain
LHKSPCGGEGTGKNPTDRAKLGWKWSIATDKNGIPIGWVVDGANRNDSVLLEPTLDDVADRGLLGTIETLWLDRGYDSDATRGRLAERAITMPSSPRSAKAAPPVQRRTSRWACAGRWSAPTRGCRTTAS